MCVGVWIWAQTCHSTWLWLLLLSFHAFPGRISPVVCHYMLGQLACKPSGASPIFTFHLAIEALGFTWVLGIWVQIPTLGQQVLYALNNLSQSTVVLFCFFKFFQEVLNNGNLCSLSIYFDTNTNWKLYEAHYIIKTSELHHQAFLLPFPFHRQSLRFKNKDKTKQKNKIKQNHITLPMVQKSTQLQHACLIMVPHLPN